MQLCVYIANHLLSDLLRCVLTNLFFWDTGLTFPRAWQWPSFRKECVACVCLVLERLGELIARVWVLKVCSGRAGSYCFRGVRQRGGQRSRFTCLRRWWEVACHACLRLRGSTASTYSAYLSRKVNEFQDFECNNRKFTSICVRYTILPGCFSLTQRSDVRRLAFEPKTVMIHCWTCVCFVVVLYKYSD